MKKSALELFVRAFLKSHNNKSAPKKFIQKAIALIEVKLNNPCCTDLESVIDLKTQFDNQLTIGVKAILNTVPLKNNRTSYVRAKTILEQYIGEGMGGCCKP